MVLLSPLHVLCKLMCQCHFTSTYCHLHHSVQIFLFVRVTADWQTIQNSWLIHKSKCLLPTSLRVYRSQYQNRHSSMGWVTDDGHDSNYHSSARVKHRSVHSSLPSRSTQKIYTRPKRFTYDLIDSVLVGVFQTGLLYEGYFPSIKILYNKIGILLWI